MKVTDIFEEAKVKVRPNKTLWFQQYPLWVQDIQHRYPDADAHRNEENEEVIALDSTGEKCYGKWNPNDMKGVTYAKARPLHNVIHPTHKLTNIEEPEAEK